MGFPETWLALQGGLRDRQVIPNWATHRRATGEPFAIAALTRNSIVVDPGGGAGMQTVRRADFEAIDPLWGDYVRGVCPRTTFTPLTRYSKYVISILHWLQQRSCGSLP